MRPTTVSAAHMHVCCSVTALLKQTVFGHAECWILHYRILDLDITAAPTCKDEQLLLHTKTSFSFGARINVVWDGYRWWTGCQTFLIGQVGLSLVPSSPRAYLEWSAVSFQRSYKAKKCATVLVCFLYDSYVRNKLMFKSYGKWGWVNDDNILIFSWTITFLLSGKKKWFY